jgi:hypothetical protein
LREEQKNKAKGDKGGKRFGHFKKGKRIAGKGKKGGKVPRDPEERR